MPNYTEHNNLILPLISEKYDVEVANENNKMIEKKLNEKQEKAVGKGLSTNDFTNEYKNKLDKLNNYDDSEIKEKQESQGKTIEQLQNEVTEVETENTSLKQTIQNLEDNMLSGEAEGEYITVNDSANYKARIDISGGSRQSGEAIVDSSVNIEVVGGNVNMIDINTLTKGYISSTGSVSTSDSNGERVSDFIKVKPNTTYTFTIFDTSDTYESWFGIGEYSSNNTANFIKRDVVTTTTATKITITTTAETEYIRVSSRNLRGATKIKLEEGQKSSYSKYGLGGDRVIVCSENLIGKEGMSTSKTDADYWNQLSTAITPLQDGWAKVEHTATGAGYLNMWINRNMMPLKANTEYTILLEIRNAETTGDAKILVGGQWDVKCAFFGNVSTNIENGVKKILSKTVDIEDFENRTTDFRGWISLSAGASVSCEFRVSIFEGDRTKDNLQYISTEEDSIEILLEHEYVRIGDTQDEILRIEDEFGNRIKYQKVQRIEKIDSYANEEINTEYISTTGKLTEGVTVYYILETAITTDITNQETIDALDYLYNMKTLKGVSNVYSQSGLANLKLSYKKDFELELEKNKVKNFSNVNIKSINHRGYNTVAPENTLSAYKLSKQKGFDFVECDVSYTSDSVPVLLHDATIDRTSNGTGNINELTFEEVRKLDFGSWKSSNYAGELIPTFEEFISLCRNIGLHPYIELKSNGSYSTEQIQVLVDIVKKYGMIDKVTWISFTAGYLTTIKEYYLKARLGYVVNSITNEVITTANSLKNDVNEVFINCNYSAVTEETANKCITSDISLEVWTINTEDSILSLNPYVSGISSDSLKAGEILYKEIIGG